MSSLMTSIQYGKRDLNQQNETKKKQAKRQFEKERLTDSLFVYAFLHIIILSVLRKNY